MHPQLGPWEEAQRVYVQGTGLAELLEAKGRGAAGEVVVFDVGLGGAANAVAAIQAAQLVRKQGGKALPLRIVSFEQDIAAPTFALENAAALLYLSGYEPALEALLDQGKWTAGDAIVWELRVGDFAQWVQEEPYRADVVFFDPFSPRSNPAMWSVPLLENVYRCHRPGRPMRLATYSSAFGVRAALLQAGFFVGEGPVLSGGRRATLASTDFAALQEPLDRGWLSRWRRDREPWPPLTPTQDHRRLRESLLAHPQWNYFDGGSATDDEAEAPPRFKRRRKRNS
jgi:tRNA U34 5-methylaminomethyl-2-thiouridine-forming methyltransferase MnmC